jgi:hypothetical protein
MYRCSIVWKMNLFFIFKLKIKNHEKFKAAYYHVFVLIRL